MGLYYLQSRYYDPELGRFLNADAFAATGQGLLGNNMFVYCLNNPVIFSDCCGTAPWPTTVAISDGGGRRPDYVIYYFHPESSANLDAPAKQNHSASSSIFVAVGSFNELVDAFNNIPRYVDDVFLYMHSDESSLSFYYAQYYSAEDIANGFEEISIWGDIYLFSCKGGRGNLASTMAKATNHRVIASMYKVSFGNGFARCGWESYFLDFWYHGAYSWYGFGPNGNIDALSYYCIYTQ